MLDRILTEILLESIENYADGREVAMYGDNDELKRELEKNGHHISGIFTGNSSLLRKSDIFINASELKGKADKYYVVIPFLLPDNGESQRDTMDKFGYEKYIDYIVYPNEDAVDKAIYNIKKYSNGRKVASYGYSESVNARFEKAGCDIDAFFTSNIDLLKRGGNFKDHRQMKDKSDRYYMIIPFFLEDEGIFQRQTMKDFGYKYPEDYCFCEEQQSNKGDERFRNKELARRLYIPDRYKDKWYNAFNKKYLSDRKLNVSELDNGVILPLKSINGADRGGVCDEKYNFIAGHLCAPTANRRAWGIFSSYTPDEKPEFVDETVVFGGAMYNHPGHLMYEMFCQRLWWCVKNPDSKLRIAICYTWGDKEGSFIRQFLELFGIDLNRIIFIQKPMKFRKIIIPDQSMYPFYGDLPYDMTKEYISVYDQIFKNIVPGKDKKIYLTKLKTGKRDIANEQYFVDFYKNKGFRIVDPEDYTIKEKAQMMAGADEVVSNIGTNTMFAVFCKPSVRITVTTRVNDQIMDCQPMAYEVRGIKDFYCVDVSLNFLHKHRIWGTNILGVTDEWKRYVKDMYGEDISDTTESSVRGGLYEYLKRSAEYYSSPNMFRSFAGYSHLEIIDNMNEVFLGKPLSTARYDQLAEVQKEVYNKGSDLSSQSVNLLLDILLSNKHLALINAVGGKSVSLLCNDAVTANALKRIFEALGFDIRFFSSKKSRLKELSGDEWNICRTAEKIISYDLFGYDPGKRDGIKAYDIKDIISDKKNMPDDIGNSGKAFNVIQELCLVRNELYRQTALLNKKTDAEKQVEKLYAERGAMNERLVNAIAAQGKLKDQLMSVEQERDNMEDSIKELNQKISDFAGEVKQIKNEYDDVLTKLKAEQGESALKDNKITALSEQISAMENSRSWRITKPLRKISSSFGGTSGKAKSE